MKFAVVLSSLLGSVLASTLAAATVASPTGVRANVTEVTETRTTGSFPARCVLELSFTGDPVYDASLVRRIQVERAVDELDRDVAPRRQEDVEHAFSPNSSGGALKARVNLRAPSRNATTIKVVEGQVELFSPSEANGGIVVVPKILAVPGEPVASAALKDNNIEVMYLTRDVAEARRKQMADQQAASEPLLAVFADAFKNMLGSGFSSMADQKNMVSIAVSDPNKRVVLIELQDAKGQRLPTRSTMASNILRQFLLQAPPPADARLLIHVATPGSVQSFPFKVENIPLP